MLEVDDSEPQQVGCKGANSKYIKLVTGDGHIFYLERAYVLLSGTMSCMLGGPFEIRNDDESEIKLKDINSVAMNKVCEYLMYKGCYTNWDVEIPEFPMERRLILDVLLAANFLNC